MTGYKIVEEYCDGLRTLFHTYEYKGKMTRHLPLGEWLIANKREGVRDGSGKTNYVSGFHFFERQEEARKYLERFTGDRKLAVVEVQAHDVWEKSHSNAPVLLCGKMLLHYKEERAPIVVATR